MSHVYHRQLVDIFLAVCDLDPAQRAERLDELCGEHHDIRSEVEALLARDAKASDFLAAPALDRPVADLLPDQLQIAVNPVSEKDDDVSPTLAIGRRFGERLSGFTILRVLGEGAMGLVFLAEQHHPKRTVAVKLIRPGIATRKMVARFEHEMVILGRLQHTGIAQIFEAGTADAGDGAQPYFVMEYVLGQTLLEFADENQLGTRERLALMVKICDAVEHAHQKGVVHRDLKPDNILVTEDGQPKILDFGVARVTDSDIQTTTLRTDLGQLIGTVPYMSPEQARGDSRELDTRSDVYALGVLVFELLSGRLPHDLKGRKIHEAIRIILDDDPMRLSACNRTLRGDVETIVAKALEKDRERRYRSASEYAQDIERYLNEEPIAAHLPSTLYQVRKFARRNRMLVGGAFAIGLVLIASTIVSMRFAFHASVQREQALRQTYIASVVAADSALVDDSITQGQAMLDRAPEHLRGWEWQYLANRFDRSMMSLEGHEFVVWEATFSPDGATLATCGGDARVRIWDVKTGRERRVLSDHLDKVFNVAYSPGGDRLVSASADLTIRIRDARSFETMVVIDDHASPVHGLAFSPDDQWLITGDSAGRLVLRAAQTGAVVRELEGHPAWIWDIAVAPDGRRFASASLDDTIKIWDVDSGACVTTLRGHTDEVISIAYSPDGALLASGSRDGTVRLWDAKGHALIATLEGHDDVVGCVAFSRDGRTLVSGGWDHLIRAWDVARREPIAVLSGHDNWVKTIAISPDGRRLASSGFDPTVKVWDAQLVEDLATPQQLSEFSKLSFRPDGHVVLTSKDARTIRFADPHTVRTEAELIAAQDAVWTSWSPHGALMRLPDNTTRVCDPISGRMRCSIEEPIHAGTFGRNGDRIAAVRPDRTVCLYDADSGRRLTECQMTFKSWPPLAISVDGRHLVTGSGENDFDAHVWDARTGASIQTLPHGRVVRGLKFSDDGAFLLTGTHGFDMYLWRVSDWKRLRSYEGNDEVVQHLAFSPDNRRVASAGANGIVRLWRIDDPEPILTISTGNGPTRSLGFSPDGFLLAHAGDLGGTIFDAMPPVKRFESRADWSTVAPKR